MTMANTQPAFHVMAKPTGSRCNLDCSYCFYLKKEQIYPESSFRMSDEVMEQYIRQTIEGHRVPRVTIAWQGGEPTLMGLDFFRRAINAEKKYLKPGMQIENTFQTNGVLLNEEWCRFFHDNNFLIGLSVDGPRHLHDPYRHDKGGAGTFEKVMRAARLLQQYKVEFNVLCTVNAINPEFNPRHWIYLIRIGMEAELLRDKDIIWQCVSCNKCTYACPRDVFPEGVMKALQKVQGVVAVERA